MKNTNDLIKDFLAYRNDDTRAKKIPTGFDKLDRLFNGGLPSGLVILGAIPSLGKTTFTLQMANNMASQENTKVLFFSLEMTLFELVAKTFSSISFQNEDLPNYISDDFMYKKDLKELDTIVGIYESIANNITFVDEVYDIRSICSYIEQFRNENPNQKIVVIIDYLQFVRCNSSNDKQAIDNIVKLLKEATKRFDITIIGISSLNRGNYDNVTMEAFKESGGIEYTADILLGLEFTNGGNREQELKLNPRKVSISVLKYRNCPMGSRVNFSFYPGYNTFFEK